MGRLVDRSKWDEAMEIAKHDRQGCNILEFNFDTDLIDGKTVMGRSMRMCVSEDSE